MRSAVVALAALSLACPGPRRAAPVTPAEAAPPRLVVLVVIDQLPAWSWPAKIAAAEQGLARIAGAARAWRGVYPFAATQTAPGHAALGTGAPPSVTGIVGNEWWDRARGAEVKASSSDLLRVDGIADALARARPAAKAVAVSLKERSARLVLGHAGLPIWYDDDCPCMVADAPPAWLAALPPIAPRIAEPWVPRDPARLAELSGGPDDAPGELAIPGWDATFPHDLTATRAPAKAVIDTPLGDAIVAEAAIAAVRGEALGADDVPDLLVVSFSAHDYVGHAFGQDSWEAWDQWLALDAQVGALLDALDAEVGAGRWALVLTGDHGAPPLPERREPPARRFTYEEVAAAADAAADEVAGAGDWIARARVPWVHLSDAARALPPARRDALLDAIVARLRAVDGVGRVERSDAFAGDCARFAGDERAICQSIDPERSGEVLYVPAEGAVIHKASWVDAVAHGSLHAYDREVPILVVAPGVAPGDAGGASTLAVAATLADLLGVPAPPAALEPSLL